MNDVTMQDGIPRLGTQAYEQPPTFLEFLHFVLEESERLILEGADHCVATSQELELIGLMLPAIEEDRLEEPVTMHEAVGAVWFIQIPMRRQKMEYLMEAAFNLWEDYQFKSYRNWAAFEAWQKID